jgi:hypothetical protein
MGSGKKKKDNDDSSNVPQTKKVQLSWDAPDSRENGDHLYLYEIGGYEIIYKKDEETQWSSVIVNDEDALAHYDYTISDLTPGRYEFAIATFDIDGLMGRYSESISVEIK